MIKSRFKFVAVLALLFQMGFVPTANAQDCAAILNNQDRLECYDKAAKAKNTDATNNDKPTVLGLEILEQYSGDRDRIEKVADAAPYAVLAWAAYEDPEALDLAKSLGWIPLKQYSGDQILAGDLSATIFSKPGEDAVLAFRGSVTRGDWYTNTVGSVSIDPVDVAQVEDAISLAEKVVSEFGPVTFVGHSLGGRLAAAASLKTGYPAYSFNSAPLGVYELTSMGFAGITKSDLNRFRSPQDPLTFVFPRSDIVVSNIVEVDVNPISNLINLKDYTHNMAVLAKAMNNVRIVRDQGWLGKSATQEGAEVTTEDLAESVEVSASNLTQDKAQWGPDIVPADNIEIGYSPCGDHSGDRNCLRELGLSDQAIDYSYAFDDNYSGQTTASKFIELGDVDLSEAQFIGASIHLFPVLLNGNLNPKDGSGPDAMYSINMTDDLFSVYSDPASQRELRKHPTASVYRTSIVGHRLINGDTQRFVLFELIQDACRACEIIGGAITFLDIKDGQTAPVRKPVAVQFFTPKMPEEITFSDLANSASFFQYRLSSLGYYGSSIDGILGGMSASAISEFQSDYCLTETGQANQETLKALTEVDLRSPPLCLNEVSNDGNQSKTAPDTGENVAWNVQSDPAMVLLTGKSVGNTSVTQDGALVFGERQILPNVADPSVVEYQLFRSPSGSAELIIQNDLDYGGLRAALIDTQAGVLINNQIVREDQVHGIADAAMVQLLFPRAAWSPDNRFVAIADSPSEWSGIIHVLSLKTGAMITITPDNLLGEDQFATPDMSSLHFTPKGLLGFTWEIWQCTQNCEDKELVTTKPSSGISIDSLYNSAGPADRSALSALEPDTPQRPASLDSAVISNISSRPDQALIDRFQPICEQANPSPDGRAQYSCPYIHTNSCQGESCSSFGPYYSLTDFELVEQPGSDQVVTTVAKGEYLFARSTTVFVAPCLVMTAKPNAQISVGITPVQLAYMGEGTYLYGSGTGVFWGDSETSEAMEPIGSCDNNAEEWVLLETEGGDAGWSKKEPDKFLGGSKYAEIDIPQPIPAWLNERINTHNASLTSGELCYETAPRALNSEVIQTVFGGSTAFGVNSKGEPWSETLSAIENSTASTQFRNAKGDIFDGLWKAENDQICFSYGSRLNWSCKRAFACFDKETELVLVDEMDNQTSAINSFRWSSDPFAITSISYVAEPPIGNPSNQEQLGENTGASGDFSQSGYQSRIENLADFIETNGESALARLSAGMNLKFNRAPAIFQNEKIIMENNVVPSSTTKVVERLNNNFNWSDWLTVTQGKDPVRTKLTVRCKFDAEDVQSGGNISTVFARLEHYQENLAVLSCRPVQ